MIANYHSHTVRCRHASGTEEEYVRSAIDGGMRIFGFSDHTPYRFPGDYYSTFRMFPEELDDYCGTVLELKKRFASQLQIHLGVEVEYYPALFSELVAWLRDTPVEYMLLGQHALDNEMGAHFSGWPTADEALLERYCDQVIEAMYTGLFTYLAHPDVIKYQGEDAIYRKHMRRLCRAAKACDLPLEINFVGIRQKRNYPDVRFWEMAAEEGCKTVLGCDAHCAADAYDRASELQAMQIVERFELELLETVPLRPI